MRQATLLFLLKRSEGDVTSILLAMKKRGFGVGRWNGVGGKVAADESVEEAALRETHEEISVVAKDIMKVAELTFIFPHKPEWDQVVHTYVTDEWVGEPTESEEMAPKWFSVKDIPYKEMWPDDPLWIPQVLKGELVRATFTLSEKDVLIAGDVKVVKYL